MDGFQERVRASGDRPGRLKLLVAATCAGEGWMGCPGVILSEGEGCPFSTAPRRGMTQARGGAGVYVLFVFFGVLRKYCMAQEWIVRR